MSTRRVPPPPPPGFGDDDYYRLYGRPEEYHRERERYMQQGNNYNRGDRQVGARGRGHSSGAGPGGDAANVGVNPGFSSYSPGHLNRTVKLQPWF